jgi:hypothetical protein
MPTFLVDTVTSDEASSTMTKMPVMPPAAILA